MNVSYNTSIYYAKIVLVRLALLIAYVLSLPSYAKHTLVLTDFDVPQHIGVTPKHIELRLSAALSALKEYNGTLYFLQAYTREKIILPKSPNLVVVPVNSKLKYYPWIRDETLGWDAKKSQFVFYNHLPSWIDAFLDVFPHDIATNTVQVPWGNFIDNGHGLCMVSETDLDLQEKENIQNEYSKNFGCRQVSVIPTITSLPHPNRHLDIFLQFVGEKKIILASIHKKCDAQDFYIQQLTNDIKKLKLFLKERHPDLTIQDVPFATCPKIIQNSFDQGESLELLSYTNSLWLGQSAIVPLYEGVPEKDLVYGYQQFILDAKLKNYPFSIPLPQASLGGSARCLTLHGF